MKKFTSIKGFNRVVYLPRLGKIRLGVLAVSEKTGKSYPREEDYFICPPEVQAIYGEKSKRIDIMFPSDNPEVIMPYCYKLYGDNNRLKCKGNGEEAVYYDFQERKWKEKTCPCELLDKGCSIRGHLMVILPRVSLGGVYQIDTGSGANINRVLDAIRYWKMTVGRVKGLLLTLERIPEKIANPDGKMIIHYLFKFGCDLSAQTLNMAIEDTKRIMAIDYQVESPKEDGELSDTPIVYVDEENGENKINNIETESEILEEESEILEEELEILEETEQNDTDGLTKFQKFLIAMDEIKKELKQKFGDEAGEKIYYKELKTRGFEHANQIKIRDEQVAVYTTLKKVLTNPLETEENLLKESAQKLYTELIDIYKIDPQVIKKWLESNNIPNFEKANKKQLYEFIAYIKELMADKMDEVFKG